ncbi:DUF4406 domain-containing protein [Arachnia propionica]|uniref:DUF4406 domain-containing protein n=1 Tax=Arachnia propionica TaxID=1750 RepID=UPI001639DC51|nr:DUF4406 domain-containing protein [Arachnia propionica]
MSAPILYIAGPITGIKNHGRRFERAAMELATAGCNTLNPARNLPKANPGLTSGLVSRMFPTWHDWMRAGLAQLIEADGVALLPGWEDSEGASWERRIAEEVLAIPALPIVDWVRLGGRLPEPSEGVRQ